MPMFRIESGGAASNTKIIADEVDITKFIQSMTLDMDAKSLHRLILRGYGYGLIENIDVPKENIKIEIIGHCKDCESWKQTKEYGDLPYTKRCQLLEGNPATPSNFGCTDWNIKSRNKDK